MLNKLKNNKYLLLILLIITSIFKQASADGAWIKTPEFRWVDHPYFGIEYKLSYTNGQRYWKQLLPNNKLYNSGTLFVGIKFLDYVAGEFGVTRSNSHTKDSDVSGMAMFGGVANSRSAQSAKLSYSSWYMDLNLQPVSTGFALLGTVGIAGIKPNLQIINQGALGNYTVLGNNDIVTIRAKSKLALRLGIGAQITKGILGMRSRIIWESTSRLKVNTGNYALSLPHVTNKFLGETFAWTFGVFVIL